MGSVCKVSKEDLKYAVEKIDYWYKKNIKNLTIFTVPFNTSCIFSNIIDVLSKNGCRILYVWGKRKENRELAYHFLILLSNTFPLSVINLLKE